MNNPRDAKTEAREEKRPYMKPKLERLGTIRDLTHGVGKQGAFDAEHPPGQNKSIV